MIYTVRCSECEHTEEWMCSVSQYEDRKENRECPECKAKGTMSSCVFSGAVQFVGSGFYCNQDRADLKGQAAQDAALRENDTLTYEFEHNKGVYKKANYLHAKAEEQMMKANGE